VSKLSDSFINWYTGEDNFSDNFLKKFASAQKGLNKKIVATSVFVAIASTASLYSKALAIIVDFFLDDSQKDARDALVKIAEEGLMDSDARIYQVVREALRLNPPISIITRTAKANVSQPDHEEIKEGQRIVCSIIEANTDVSSHCDLRLPDLFSQRCTLGDAFRRKYFRRWS